MKGKPRREVSFPDALPPSTFFTQRPTVPWSAVYISSSTIIRSTLFAPSLAVAVPRHSYCEFASPVHGCDAELYVHAVPPKWGSMQRSEVVCWSSAIRSRTAFQVSTSGALSAASVARGRNGVTSVSPESSHLKSDPSSPATVPLVRDSHIFELNRL